MRDKNWRGNIDSFICSRCGLEVSNPMNYEGCKCPRCGTKDTEDTKRTMQTYEDIRREIVCFLQERRIRPYDLIRVGKDLCRCGTCRFFRQHYSKTGNELDFGHCGKNKIPRSVKPYDNSCGFWDMEEQL